MISFKDSHIDQVNRFKDAIAQEKWSALEAIKNDVVSLRMNWDNHPSYFSYLHLKEKETLNHLGDINPAHITVDTFSHLPQLRILMDKLNDGFEKREHKLLGDFEKERQRLILKNTHKVQRMTERFTKQEEETLQRFQTEIDKLKADHQKEKGTVVFQLTFSLRVYGLKY